MTPKDWALLGVRSEPRHQSPRRAGSLAPDLAAPGRRMSGTACWVCHGGTPNSWMVFVMENPDKKWMMTRGMPLYGNPHIMFICLSH